MGRQRVPRTRAGNTWTESRYFSFIRSALRLASSKYPVKFQVLDDAKRIKPKGKAGKHRFEFLCNECGGWFANKDVSVDHIVPAGSLKTYEDLPGFAERLFCEPEGMQILCTDCHHVKTQAERKAR